MITCENCGHTSTCARSQLLNNTGCSNYISKSTYNEVYQHGYEIPTYEEFHKQFEHLNCEQWLEVYELFQKYVDTVLVEWNTKYTWCTGCKKYVERSRFYTKVEDNTQLTRCSDCHTVWNIKDVEE